MTIYIVSLAFSGLGILFITIKNFLKFDRIYKQNKEIAREIGNSLFFSEIEKYIVFPVKNFLETKFIPFIFKKTEKIAHQIRIYILKFENKILKFNNYIKGKRILKENGIPSDYVQKLNGFKQDNL